LATTPFLAINLIYVYFRLFPVRKQKNWLKTAIMAPGHIAKLAAIKSHPQHFRVAMQAEKKLCLLKLAIWKNVFILSECTKLLRFLLFVQASGAGYFRLGLAFSCCSAVSFPCHAYCCLRLCSSDVFIGCGRQPQYCGDGHCL
jgi:hypothetical protein